MFHVFLLTFYSLKILRHFFYLKGTSEKPATLWALYKTLHPWQMKVLTEDTAMAVRTPHDCLYNHANRQVLHLYFILCFVFSSLGKIGNSDCENIGGSCESLSSPGNSTSLHLSHMQMKTLQWYTGLISSLSPWKCTIEANFNRRLPKTPSTLTVSSDDLDERDTLEPGLLLFIVVNLAHHWH